MELTGNTINIMEIKEQIRLSKLVCPKTKEKLNLSPDGQWLIAPKSNTRYKLLNKKIPIMLVDENWANGYMNHSPKMITEYTPEMLQQKESMLGKLKKLLTQDHRTPKSVHAFHAIFDNLPDDSQLCLSIGGGPLRPHPKLINVNIGPFPNVEVVADAHLLPYADNSVDAIYCEAVFEHLYNPSQAIKEIYRVLKPNKMAFVCTPFMQSYHGYPHHYQNYTLSGHRYIFETAGFEIIEAGVCVGPVYTIVSLVSVFLREYSPSFLARPVTIVWELLATMIRPLDKILNKKDNAFVLASTTYVLIRKIVCTVK